MNLADLAVSYKLAVFYSRVVFPYTQKKNALISQNIPSGCPPSYKAALLIFSFSFSVGLKESTIILNTKQLIIRDCCRPQ